MKGFLRLAGTIGLACLNLTACDRHAEERQILTSQLQESDSNRTMLTQTIAGRRSTVAYLEQQLSRQRSDLAQFEGQVKAFVMDHKMAVAAIAAGVGGAGVAMDSSNRFTPGEQEAAGWVAAGAALYALANSEEVTHVLDQLVQAESHAKTLEGHIASTNEQLRNELYQLQEEEQRLAALNRQAADLRAQLLALE
jgi:septal ring factor EnvC (AmiA/AmiB activator)